MRCAAYLMDSDVARVSLSKCIANDTEDSEQFLVGILQEMANEGIWKGKGFEEALGYLSVPDNTVWQTPFPHPDQKSELICIFSDITLCLGKGTMGTKKFNDKMEEYTKPKLGQLFKYIVLVQRKHRRTKKSS